MIEIWKDIPDYEGYYQVSNLGNVKSINHYDKQNRLRKEKILKPIINHDYLIVNLSKNGKTKYKRIHRLVLSAFIGKSNLQVDHINCNKKDNRIENLEYVTAKENTKRAWDNGLSSSPNNRKVKQFDKNGIFIKEWNNITQFLKQNNKNIKSGNIHNCCSGRSKTAYGYIWRYGDKW